MKRHPVLIAITPFAAFGAVRIYRELTALFTDFGDVMAERGRWHEAENQIMTPKVDDSKVAIATPDLVKTA